MIYKLQHKYFDILRHVQKFYISFSTNPFVRNVQNKGKRYLMHYQYNTFFVIDDDLE